MPYLDNIRVGGITYRDARGPFRGSRIEDDRLKFKERFESQHDHVRVEEGTEPGCEVLREEYAAAEFDKIRLDPDETRNYSQWRRDQEALRVCQDSDTGESFILLGRRRDPSEPIGGMLIYDIEINNTDNQGVIHYTAKPAPFTIPIPAGMNLMLHLLDNTTEGVDDEDNPIVMQLNAWKFSIQDRRNRWYTARPQAEHWFDRFSLNHDLILETRNNREFIRALRKLPAGGG